MPLCSYCSIILGCTELTSEAVSNQRIQYTIHNTTQNRLYYTGYRNQNTRLVDFHRRAEHNKVHKLGEGDDEEKRQGLSWGGLMPNRGNTKMLTGYTITVCTHLSLPSFGPGKDCGFTCASVMNSFFSRLPTKIRILDSTKPTLSGKRNKAK